AVEWPFEVLDDPLPALAHAELASLRALLAGRELPRNRPRLYRLLTGGSEDAPVALHDVDDERLQRIIDRARALPLGDPEGNRAPGPFLARWDLDGDGAVGPHEHDRWDVIAPRCDRDGNGRIDARDRPAAGGAR